MKILFGSIVTDARGRLNGHVFKKTAFGNSISALALPRNRFAWQLNPQLTRNTWYFTQWNLLTVNEKNFANQFAAQNPLPNKFGVLRNIGGRAMFVKLSQLKEFPQLGISTPTGWENVSPSADWSILGINGSTGILSLEVDNVNEFIGFAVYVQQVSRTRLVPPSNRWRRFENMEAEGNGIINSLNNIFLIAGSPRTNTQYWLRIITFNASGWAGETVISAAALD